MPDSIQKTTCLSPKDHDGKPGQEAAAMRSLWPLVVGAIASALLGWPWGTLLGGAGLTASVQLFLNWWLNRRLLCLGGDRCAIGIVWSVEPAEGKPFPESFDDDFSINILLSPAEPGDEPERFPTQVELVREQSAIKAAGLATFGDAVVAVSVRGCLEKDPEQVTFLNPGKKGFASVEVPEDPDLDKLEASLTSWEQFLATGSKKPADFSSLWEAEKVEGSLPEGWQKSSLPNTQLLHIEFEGNTIANLQGVLLVVGIIGTAATAGIAVAAAALGAAGTVFLPLLVLALLLLLIAFLTHAVSHQGSPSDAADDPLSGDPKPIGTDTFGTCGPWDNSFNLVGVIGRWIYDSGHSRGWNELHPVKFIQLLATAESEHGRQQLPIDPKDASKGNLRGTRPTNDPATKDFLNFWCQEVAASRDPVFKSQQRQALTDLHPSVHNSDVR